MRLKCLKTTAKLAPVDTFIYLPKKKMFFFVDDKDYDDKNIIFYFEEGIDEKNGNIIESELVFNENDEVLIVSQYKVNPKELIKEINEQEKYLLEEEEEEEEEEEDDDDDKKY